MIIIISPLLVLMQDQVKKLSSLGFKAAFVGPEQDPNIGTQGVQELFFCELKDCGGSSIHVTVYTVMVWLI